jgi:hypothetical protein
MKDLLNREADYALVGFMFLPYGSVWSICTLSAQNI